MRLGEVAVPAATLVPLVLAVLCGLAAWRAYRARRRWLVALSAAGAPLFLAATMGGMPVALTNAQLQMLPSYQWSSVLRLGVNTLGDAPPLWFTPSTTACAISGGDVGSQVPSVDGGCFNAIYGAATVDAREWGFFAGGPADHAPALQAALNYVYSQGGGAVFVAAGQYIQQSQLVVPPHVRLQCQENGATAGTLMVRSSSAGVTFYVEWGSGSGSAGTLADTDIILNPGATIDSCGFFYPAQVISNTVPIEYGATIGIQPRSGITGGNLSQTATRNFCFNCYSFLDFRGSLSNAGVGAARIENNLGYPLAYGMRINFVSEWGHYGHNVFHAGGFDIGDPNFATNLGAWTLHNGVAIEIGNSDWINLNDEQEWGYSVGVNLVFNGPYYASRGPVWLINSQFDACTAACVLDAPSTTDTGIMALRIKNNTFTAFQGIPSAQSPSTGGIVLSINGNSSPQIVDFSGNFIFGPTNYITYGGNVTDFIISGNTSYPNVSSTIAAAGPAFTLGNGITTAVITNNIMRGFASVHNTPATPPTTLVDTGNFVH